MEPPEMVRHGVRSARGWRRAAACGCALTALLAASAGARGADDPTFRELPGAPSPGHLAERLMELPRPGDDLGLPDEDLDALLQVLPDASQLLEDQQLREWAESFARDNPQALDPGNRGTLIEQLRRQLESDPELRDLVSRLAGSSMRSSASEPARRTGPRSAGRRSDPMVSGQANAFRTPEPPSSDERPPLDARQLEQLARPEPRPSASPTRPARPATPESPPATLAQFQSRLQRLVMDAATEVLEDPENRSHQFLQPLLHQLQGVLSNTSSWKPSPSRRSTAGAWSRARGWIPRHGIGQWLPDRPTPQPPSVLSTVWWTAVLVVAVVTAILLAGYGPVLQRKLGRRFGGRGALGGWGSITSGAQLVRGLDRYLHHRFGSAASWWSCRTVQRSLEQIHPDMALDIASLVATYERARYGPRSHRVGGQDLADAAEILQRLALSGGGRFAPRPLASPS